MQGKILPRTNNEGVEADYSFFDLGTRWGFVFNAMARPPYPRERDLVPYVQEAGWAPGPFWVGAGKLAPPSAFDPRTTQPVASHYTGYVIPAHFDLPKFGD